MRENTNTARLEATRPTFTDRTLPHPWELCDVCGKAPGFPLPGYRFPTCPECSRRQVLQDAAQASLTALAAPVVGAWAAQWTAAGLSLEALDGLAEIVTGAWAKPSYARRFRRVFLRRLSRQHAPPAFTVAGPDRVALDVEALPCLTTYRSADRTRGMTWPHFLDGEGRPHTLPAGLDSLTLTQPDGGAVLIFTGLGGQTDFTRAGPHRPPGFRVPAHLLPQVRAALEGARA